MVCPFRVFVVILTALTCVYVAVREFLFPKEEGLVVNDVDGKKTPKYSLWDYYTGKWTYDILVGKERRSSTCKKGE